MIEVAASGSPGELGLQHGRRAQCLVRSGYGARMARAAQHTSEAAVLSRAMNYLPYAERYVPELVEEVRGIAMGAQMDFREVFFLQVATELELAAEGGCSAVGAAQSTVGPFVGQNWDQPPGAYETQIVLRLCPNDGPRIMMFARAGIVGYIGVNSSGVGHVCNQLYSSSPPGLTGYFLMRKFLSFDSVDKAVSWLDAIKIGSCGNYLLGDSTGTLLDLELGGGTVQQMRETVLCHTNHYVAADSDGVDECHSRLPDSVHRYDRLVSVFGMSGRFEDAIRALKDHSGYPASVCRHGACGMSTAASIVIKLREREMLVCEGNPCLGRYTSFRL